MFINKFKKKTDYDIRICCKYNEILGPWSEIYKIKTKENNYKYPHNPKYIKMNYKNKEYALISHRYHGNDNFSIDKTKLAMHCNYLSCTPVKWLLIPDENGYVSIIYDIENEFHMMNWKIYSDEKNILLCKNLSSKFEIIMINENKFYIKDIKTGKYLCISKNIRDEVSYFIEFENIDEIDIERFIFYV